MGLRHISKYHLIHVTSKQSVQGNRERESSTLCFLMATLFLRVWNKNQQNYFYYSVVPIIVVFKAGSEVYLIYCHKKCCHVWIVVLSYEKQLSLSDTMLDYYAMFCRWKKVWRRLILWLVLVITIYLLTWHRVNTADKLG